MNPTNNHPDPSSSRSSDSSADELATLSGGSSLLGFSPGSSSRTAQKPTFAAGDRIAGRYAIIEFIARGGMGEVYEAEDLELHERVALKTVRSDIASDERSVERFKREIQLARKVTHPNVCRIFEFGVHHTEGQGGLPGADILFLTMELLRGETLAGYLRHRGRMSPQEAMPLVRQVADALSAAHKAGVVHRDFKSANVLLVDASGAGQPLNKPGVALRAVVTDFGLARSSGGDSASLSSASGLHVVGTPAYMAPEQVRGHDVTAAADIYAFGVVLYEMLTGILPFAGDLQAVVYRRLFEDPTPPRNVVAGLDPRWEATVLRCMEREPSDRFRTVSEVILALEGGEVPPGRPERLQAQKRARRARSVGIAAAVTLFLGANGLWLLRYFEPAGPPAAQNGSTSARRSVAILGLKNLSGRPETAWLSTALSELLGTEIAAGDQLRLIPGENVARTRIELQLGDSDSYSKETLDRIHQNLGADLVVLGSYLALGEDAGKRIRLDLRLQDTQAGETLAAVSETGTEAQLLDLISNTGAKFRAKLGVRELSATESAELAASKPATSEAARLYAEGLESLRLFDALAAKDRLEAAADAEPANPLVQASLSEAWSRLGYEEQLRQTAKKAFELSAQLPRTERLVVEGRYHESMRDWDGAVKAYQTLFNFYPDSLDYGLRLASAQIAAGRGTQALATIDELRRLPAPSRDDPRIDLAEAQAAGVLSDLRRQLDAAGRAIEKGQRQGAKLLVAEARLATWMPLVRTNRPKEAQAACEEARTLFAEAGDRGGEARALSSLAYVLRYFTLDMAKSVQLYQQAIAISRELGDKRSLAFGLRGLGLTLRENRKEGMDPNEVELLRQDALASNEESLAIFQEIGDRSGIAWAMTNLGYDLADAGKLEQAESKFEQSLQIFRELGERDGVANALTWLAETAKMRGALERAVERMEQSLSLARETGNTKGVTNSLFGLAMTLSDVGKMDEANARLMELLESHSASQDMKGVSMALDELASLSLRRGDMAGAKNKLNKSQSILKGLGINPAQQITYQASQGWVYFFEGQLTEAKERFTAGLEVLKAEGKMGYDGSVTTGLARVRIEQGETSAAEVEAEARAKLENPDIQKVPARALWQQELLLRALLAQDRVTEASQLANEVVQNTKEGPIVEARLCFGMMAEYARGRAAGSGIEVDRALEKLDAILAEATQIGLYPLELEVRLSIGHLELLSGQVEEGRRRLEALRQEANSRDYLFYGRKADLALKASLSTRKQG